MVRLPVRNLVGCLEMITACFESRSAESVWHALLADKKLHGAWSMTEPNPKLPKSTGRQACAGERLSLIRVQTAKWGRISLASHGGGNMDYFSRCR